MIYEAQPTDIDEMQGLYLRYHPLPETVELQLGIRHESRWFVARGSDGGLDGFLLAQLFDYGSEPEGFIHVLTVRPESDAADVGNQLLVSAVEWLASKNCVSITGAPVTTGAKYPYELAGFRAIGLAMRRTILRSAGYVWN